MTKINLNDELKKIQVSNEERKDQLDVVPVNQNPINDSNNKPDLPERNPEPIPQERSIQLGKED